jgi:phosphatidate cytidylyltransferase
MNKELIKRIITSVILISLLGLVFFYTYILLISLIIISLVAWIEFNNLISKIFIKKKFQTKLLRVLIKFLTLLYLSLFSVLIFNGIAQVEASIKINIIYLFAICIISDIGGLIFGKIFKGKKLTKISPNKTISGSIGSFFLSILLVPVFYYIYDKNIALISLLLLSISVSLSCQLGDLFISYLKRKAKVKDTGDLLPGHGGVLDRIDGILFAIPVGMMLWKFL